MMPSCYLQLSSPAQGSVSLARALSSSMLHTLNTQGLGEEETQSTEEGCDAWTESEAQAKSTGIENKKPEFQLPDTEARITCLAEIPPGPGLQFPFSSKSYATAYQSCNGVLLYKKNWPWHLGKHVEYSLVATAFTITLCMQRG